jgi:hypothetical protein
MGGFQDPNAQQPSMGAAAFGGAQQQQQFPGLGGQQQEKKTDAAATTSLNKGAAEFVPKGKMVKTEE